MRVNDFSVEDLPVYGCITGLKISSAEVELFKGVNLYQGTFSLFSTPMFAFKDAPNGGTTPGPWAAIDSGFTFKSQVGFSITSVEGLPWTSISQAIWAIAALLRLKHTSPIRIPVVSTIPLDELHSQKVFCGLPFEVSPHQIGCFNSEMSVLDTKDFLSLKSELFVLANLLREESFLRAWSIFDECVWSARIETAIIHIWTALEIFFGLSGENYKAKKISAAIAKYLFEEGQERDEARARIRGLYEKRCRVVHAGRSVNSPDFIDTYLLARAIFYRAVVTQLLPDY